MAAGDKDANHDGQQIPDPGHPSPPPDSGANVSTAASSSSPTAVAASSSSTIDALARRVQESLALGKRHRFWETQPVGQFKDVGDLTLSEGPIEPPTPLSEVKAEPYSLPASYGWSTCDISDDAVATEIYNLLTANYVEDDENMFRFNYSREFLRWALRPPGYYRAWHIGVRVRSSRKLVAFISGVPARIRVGDDVVRMAEINFLCVHKKLRSKRLAPVMIKEVTRRVHLEDIWQAAYTAGVVIPTPITTTQYWHRSLNPKKLIDVGFSRLGPRMTMSRTIKLYKLPDSVTTPGFRKMELRDVPAVTRLLRSYLAQFAVAPDFDEKDVEHWLLPRENVVDSYLVESLDTHDVTDFCSFYTLPSSILTNQNYSVLRAAYSYYNVAIKTPLLQLMHDTLIVAKQKDYDVFNALDVMHNETFLKELKFGPGDGQLHYYLYNYRLQHPLKPSELGLVLL
uniref:Glycylpeptide N-tetradecanoyltransferase n=1 Tax=Anthurium amnicola TaxID=1678845 RepID=A0A1D1Z667_9ARAE